MLENLDGASPGRQHHPVVLSLELSKMATPNSGIVASDAEPLLAASTGRAVLGLAINIRSDAFPSFNRQGWVVQKELPTKLLKHVVFKNNAEMSDRLLSLIVLTS